MPAPSQAGRERVYATIAGAGGLAFFLGCGILVASTLWRMVVFTFGLPPTNVEMLEAASFLGALVALGAVVVVTVTIAIADRRGVW